MPTNMVGQELVLKRLEFLKRISSLSNGELLSALEAQRKADPNDVLAVLKLGHYHEASGNFDLARQSYEAALKLNSNAPSALVRLASLEVDRNAALANRLIRSAQSFQPESHEIDWVLGRLAMRTGDFVQAYSLLQSSLEGITNQASLWLDCSKAAFGAGRLPESLDAAEKVIKMGAKPEQSKAASQIAEMLALALNPSKAGTSSDKIEAVLKAESGHAPARFALGVSLAQRGKDKEAKAAFDAVLSSTPSCIAAVRELALLYGNRLGDDAKASELGTRARSAFPDDSSLARMLGLVAQRGGDHRYAVQLLSDVASKESGDAELQYQLGSSLFALKRYEEAKVALEKAIAIEPNAKFVPKAKRMLKDGKTG
jgi:tetratricopeptide (TPR) repeat protein